MVGAEPIVVVARDDAWEERRWTSQRSLRRSSAAWRRCAGSTRAGSAGWSVKDLIGNVARWDADALDDLGPDDPRTRQICREIAEDTWQHDDEHPSDIRAWRIREGI